MTVDTIKRQEENTRGRCLFGSNWITVRGSTTLKQVERRTRAVTSRASTPSGRTAG